MMTLAQFLMLVASWCSVPSYSRIDVEQTNNCRKKLIDCAKLKSDSIMVVEDSKVLECIKLQKLPE